VYGDERHVWFGQSGNSYAYRIIPFPVYRCDIPEINGNFIFTRLEKNNVEYIPLYIGFGNLYEFFFEDPLLIRRIYDKSVEQIHYHNHLTREQQEIEAKDIIRNYQKSVLETEGCNRRTEEWIVTVMQP